MFIFNHAKKKNSESFEYTHFMDQINVVLEIECNLIKDIQWSCLGLILKQWMNVKEWFISMSIPPRKEEDSYTYSCIWEGSYLYCRYKIPSILEKQA